MTSCLRQHDVGNGGARGVELTPGDWDRISTRGWGQSKEDVEAHRLVVAPPLLGHRSDAGDEKSVAADMGGRRELRFRRCRAP